MQEMVQSRKFENLQRFSNVRQSPVEGDSITGKEVEAMNPMQALG